MLLDLVPKSNASLCGPMESSVHGRLQERILGWVAMPSSRGSSRPQGLYPALPHCRWILYHLNHQGRPDSAIVIYFSGSPWVPYENPGGYAKVHSKGNQSCLFIGRTDAEAETSILWPPDSKNWLTGKDPDAGKDWRQEEKGTTEDELVGWHYRLDGLHFE